MRRQWGGTSGVGQWYERGFQYTVTEVTSILFIHDWLHTVLRSRLVRGFKCIGKAVAMIMCAFHRFVPREMVINAYVVDDGNGKVRSEHMMALKSCTSYWDLDVSNCLAQ